MSPQSELKPRVHGIVLVVEDEVLVRMAIAQYLRDCGYRVIEAVNGEEAMTVLADEAAGVDVVFTDIEMPGAVDGFGLAKWIRERRPGVDVILTGTVSRAVSAADPLCGSGPIPKPYEPQVVHNHIRRLLATRNRSEGKKSS
jgi:DNA-binding NtrC family response regulator